MAFASLGCPDDPDYSPQQPQTRDTNVYLNVDAPDTVVMVAGDRLVVEIDQTTNNHKGRTLPMNASCTRAVA